MTYANITLKEAGEILESAQSIVLFPHMNPDPDSLGASLALCLALRQQGRDARILVDGPLPGYLKFMEEQLREEQPVFVTGQDIPEQPDISFSIDCNDDGRIPGRTEAFRKGRTSLCIDHHLCEECDRDHYYIDPDAAAASQIIWQLMREMQWPLDESIAESLYIGLSGDTGNFMHSNTTAEVHRIAADLIEYGVDVNKISVKLYQSKDPKEARLEATALKKMELIGDGKAVVSALTLQDQLDCGLEPGQSDLIIDALRDIAGIEIAACLKDSGEKVRCNLRSKGDANVAEIAVGFGGGGHIKAAGFRTDMALEEVYPRLKEEILKALEAIE